MNTVKLQVELYIILFIYSSLTIKNGKVIA